jgi:hypothetical protein
MLQAAVGCTPGGVPGKGEDWLAAFKPQTPALLACAQELGFTFLSGQRPRSNNRRSRQRPCFSE